jgi:hypothetical protein
MGDPEFVPPPVMRVLPSEWVEEACNRVAMDGPAAALSFASDLEERFGAPGDDQLRSDALKLAAWLRAMALISRTG